MFQFVINLSAGAALGFGFYHLAAVLIQKRVPDNPWGRRSLPAAIVCAALGGGLAAGLSYWLDAMALWEFMLLAGICGAIAGIDAAIRRIPNILLAALMVLRLLSVLIHHRYDDIRWGLIGLAVGLIAFSLPQLLKIDIGAGDIKYAAAAGFYLGMWGLIQALAAMLIPLAFYLIYLLITKKGNWKTLAAMGPFLSLGILFTALFPLF